MQSLTAFQVGTLTTLTAVASGGNHGMALWKLPRVAPK